jgi:hypothetical protein
MNAVSGMAESPAWSADLGRMQMQKGLTMRSQKVGSNSGVSVDA